MKNQHCFPVLILTQSCMLARHRSKSPANGFVQCLIVVLRLVTGQLIDWRISC